jgi:hypothetical protein
MTDEEVLQMTQAITKQVTSADLPNVARAKAAYELEAARVTVELLKFFKRMRDNE